MHYRAHVPVLYSQNGSTPLHLAAQSGEADCVEALLSCTGIDCNIKDNVGIIKNG